MHTRILLMGLDMSEPQRAALASAVETVLRDFVWPTTHATGLLADVSLGDLVRVKVPSRPPQGDAFVVFIPGAGGAAADQRLWDYRKEDAPEGLLEQVADVVRGFLAPGMRTTEVLFAGRRIDRHARRQASARPGRSRRRARGVTPPTGGWAQS